MKSVPKVIGITFFYSLIKSFKTTSWVKLSLILHDRGLPWVEISNIISWINLFFSFVPIIFFVIIYYASIDYNMGNEHTETFNAMTKYVVLGCIIGGVFGIGVVGQHNLVDGLWVLVTNTVSCSFQSLMLGFSAASFAFFRHNRLESQVS